MKMESLELVTKDNVTLRAFYFASDKGKEAVPVIIVHEWQGQASPYGNLAKSLWEAGCAIIVPELRGHGGSRSYQVAGRQMEFDTARMSKSDVGNMITGDMEAVKKYLREENNANRLNLNALTLIGVGGGAVIAAQWAVGDLNFPSVGSMKQGQDVKALALVSPEKILRGVSLDETLQDRYLWQLPFTVIVGRGSPQFSDADRFYKRLETMKKRAGKGTTTGLQMHALPTSLTGPALVNEAPGVIEKLTSFVKAEVVDKASKIPWVLRE
jgi:pimeloyl-ACP methyl ester carboxylesterase